MSHLADNHEEDAWIAVAQTSAPPSHALPEPRPPQWFGTTEKPAPDDDTWSTNAPTEPTWMERNEQDEEPACFCCLAREKPAESQKFESVTPPLNSPK
jgi:hypothetical protein